MAERKPLFMSSIGYAQEMDPGDSITLGSLQMGGNINLASAGKVINSVAASGADQALVYGQTGPSLQDLTISAAPTATTHAANKAYVDAQALRGGTVKEAIVTSVQLSSSLGLLSAGVLTLQNNATNDDRVVLTDGTTTRTYFFGTGSGDVQVTVGANAVESMQYLAASINGDGSGLVYAYYAANELDSIDTDGVIRIIEKTNAGGEIKIYGTNWDAGDCQIVDFGGESDYTKTTLTDIPSSAPGSTNFGFRRVKASLENGEIHNVLYDDVLYMWDADSGSGAGAWVTFSGVGAISEATSASGGGVKGKATYDTDKGFEVTSGVVGLTLSASSGLEFSGGALRIDVANADHFSIDANGLNVEGLPSLFKIDTVAVGATVTAANLDDICDGSNADSLHLHTGSSITINHSQLGSITENQHHNRLHAITSADHTASGLTTGQVLTATGATTFAFQAVQENPAAQKTEVTITTATDATSDGDPVYANGNDTVGKADASNDTKARLMGVIRSGSGAAGSDVEIVGYGPCADVLTGATVNTPYYLQVGGGIGTSQPAAGNRVMCVGYAMNTTDLFVRITDYGKTDA